MWRYSGLKIRVIPYITCRYILVVIVAFLPEILTSIKFHLSYVQIGKNRWNIIKFKCFSLRNAIQHLPTVAIIIYVRNTCSLTLIYITISAKIVFSIIQGLAVYVSLRRVKWKINPIINTISYHLSQS